MPTTISLNRNFNDGFQQTVETAMENLTSMTLIEMKKLAPWANPAQYPDGYFNSVTGWTRGGSLSASLHMKGSGLNTSIESFMPYAIKRNYENDLNPQTKLYVERSIENILRGDSSRWFLAESWVQ